MLGPGEGCRSVLSIDDIESSFTMMSLAKVGVAISSEDIDPRKGVCAFGSPKRKAAPVHIFPSGSTSPKWQCLAHDGGWNVAFSPIHTPRGVCSRSIAPCSAPDQAVLTAMSSAALTPGVSHSHDISPSSTSKLPPRGPPHGVLSRNPPSPSSPHISSPTAFSTL